MVEDYKTPAVEKAKKIINAIPKNLGTTEERYSVAGYIQGLREAYEEIKGEIQRNDDPNSLFRMVNSRLNEISKTLRKNKSPGGGWR